MELINIKNALENYKKGKYIHIKYRTETKGVTKVTSGVVRLGVKYANMKCNEGKEKVVTESLSWANWLDCYTLEHKTNGNKYLRIYNAYRKNATKTLFFYEGKRISKEKANEILNSKSTVSPCKNINIENVLELGKCKSTM